MTIPQVGFQYEVESETQACSCRARTGKPYNLTISLLLLNADRYTDAAFFGFHEHKTMGWQHCREGIKDAQYDDPNGAPGRAA